VFKSYINNNLYTVYYCLQLVRVGKG